MAAKNDTELCPKGAPTKISDGAVANARAVGDADWRLIATTADVAPVTKAGGIPLQAYSILAADLDLADLFPGLTGPFYLWCWPIYDEVRVSISHA